MMNQQNFQTNAPLNANNEEIRRDLVIGSRRFSNYWWASVLFLGGCGFLFTGISSKLQMNLLPFIHYEDVQFFPQGLVMSFYGIIALILSLYLGACIAWSVGGGFNEFNKKDGFVRIFRWGFPGKNRRIELVYALKEIDCIKVDLQEGLNPRRSIYLRLKGKRDILLTRIGQPLTLEEIEKQAADLARFLQVGLEGIA
jgi:Ycf4